MIRIHQGTSNPRTKIEVETLLAREIASLPNSHRRELLKLLVSPYAVSILDCPGESVYVVAKRGEYVLYWSDVEAGWEWDALDRNGALARRGSNQFELSHITHQLFGEPDAARPTNIA